MNYEMSVVKPHYSLKLPTLFVQVCAVCFSDMNLMFGNNQLQRYSSGIEVH